MEDHHPETRTPEPEGADRRSFLTTGSSLLMVGGLAAGYGLFTHVAGRYLYPAKPRPMAWLYVADLATLPSGTSITWRTPEGSKVAIARRGTTGTATDFVALGSTCPHLGCQVHWEGQANRFFCPCHNGAFDPDGRAISGPPAESKQSLPRFPLKVERGLLFIEVPMDERTVAEGIVTDDADPRGPGHDPCLQRRAPRAGEEV